MTLIIQKPTGAKLVLRKELPADADADAYIAAVEAADGQALEPGVKFAIKNFVLCCKDDGIWNAIKASCILAGARTLTGALVPLVGTAPTNFNFVSGDYNRKTGLVGNGSSKYLNSNRANNADPLNNMHISAYIVSQARQAGNWTLAGANNSNTSTTHLYNVFNNTAYKRSRSNGPTTIAASAPATLSAGIYGINRATPASFSWRAGGSSGTTNTASIDSNSIQYNIFAKTSDNTQNALEYCPQTIAFYSIGESLSLTQLDTRVTDLINAIGAAF